MAASMITQAGLRPVPPARRSAARARRASLNSTGVTVAAVGPPRGMPLLRSPSGRRRP